MDVFYTMREEERDSLNSQQSSQNTMPAVISGTELANQPGDDSDKGNTVQFTSKWRLLLTCLGCVVGTGNIWRFPRIVANNTDDKGGLVFILVWVLFLFFWSIPMLTIEYTLGRKTKKAVVGSFLDIGGDWTLWAGLWICLVSFFISCYYAVILGWCFYYTIYFMSHSLPDTHVDSKDIFDNLQSGDLNYLTTAAAIVLPICFTLKGVKWIEIVSMILVPFLLLIIVGTFIWSLTTKHAWVGLKYMFTPNFESFSNPRLWIDAISQNAFDTGAGAGLMVAYSTSMANYEVVKYAHIVPAANNLVSLICGMTIFGAVFSSLIASHGSMTNEDILDVLKDSGTGNTGLTFIWMPVLFEQFEVLGQVLNIMFFICLSVAGITSLMANMELFTRTVKDFKVAENIPRYLVSITLAIVMYAIGLISAREPKFLINQDFVWGFGLIINGTLFVGLLVKYGVAKYAFEVNCYLPPDYSRHASFDDFRMHFLLRSFIKFMAIPIGVLLVIAWGVYRIVDSDEADALYELGPDTFMMAIIQWLSLFLILLTANAGYWYWNHRRPEDSDIEPTETTPLSSSSSYIGRNRRDRLSQTPVKTVF